MSEKTDSHSEKLDEILAECIRADEAGDAVGRETLLAAHPDLADELREFFANRDRLRQLAGGIEDWSRQRSFVPPTVRYFGDYELLEEIARGGMGVVYKARQTSLDRIVAVKMLLAGNLASEDDVRRFRTEAESAANLQHPHIVSVHEVGTCDGHQYFSMDYVAGQTLADISAAGPLDPQDAARYLLQASSAIEYAHQQGVLHRDIKPSNILIDHHDQVRITDFGLAGWIQRSSSLTRTGQALGTPGYMPPEQAAGRKALVGPPSDVYALGAVLYTLLTGRPPFDGATPAQTLQKVLHAEPESPRAVSPSVSRDLATICLKCLQKEPRGRYGTAALLAQDLKRFLDGKPIFARPLGRAELSWRWCRRNPALAALATVAAGLLGVLSAIMMIANLLDPNPVPRSGSIGGENPPSAIAEPVAAELVAAAPAPSAAPAAQPLERTNTEPESLPQVVLRDRASIAASQLDRLGGESQPWHWDGARMHLCRKISLDDELFVAVLKLRPDDAGLWSGRGQVLALANQWQEATEAYSRVEGRRDVRSEDALQLACLYLLTNQPDAYRSLSTELVTQAGEVTDPKIAYVLAKVCTLVSEMPATDAEVLRWAEHATTPQRYPWRLHLLGAACYRTGQYQRAIELMQEAEDPGWHLAGYALNAIVSALAYQRLGDSTQAEAEMIRAQELIEVAENPAPMDWLVIHVLLREAENLIQGKQSLDKSDQPGSR